MSANELEIYRINKRELKEGMEYITQELNRADLLFHEDEIDILFRSIPPYPRPHRQTHLAHHALTITPPERVKIDPYCIRNFDQRAIGAMQLKDVKDAFHRLAPDDTRNSWSAEASPLFECADEVYAQLEGYMQARKITARDLFLKIDTKRCGDVTLDMLKHALKTGMPRTLSLAMHGREYEEVGE